MTNKVIVFDLRICQWCSERGMSKVIQYLVLQIAQANSQDMQCYFLIEDKEILPPRHFELSRLGTFFFEKKAPSLFRQKRIDAYFLPNLYYDIPSLSQYLLPPFLKPHRPQIFVLVHDLIPWIFKNHYLTTPLALHNYEITLEILKQADHLFAVSLHTQSDLIKYLNIPQAKISVIYNSGELNHQVLAKNSEHTEPFIEFPFGSLQKSRYLLYISGNDWRKNNIKLVEAYCSAHAFIKMPLVLVSISKEELKQELRQTVLEGRLIPDRDVFIIDFLSDEDLQKLTVHAFASLFPSLYEGLGLPIIESYFAKTPVFGSNTSSVQELIHPACQFDPSDRDSIEGKLKEISVKPELLQKSLEFGRKILERFLDGHNVRMLNSFLNKPHHSIAYQKKSMWICSEEDLDGLHYFQGDIFISCRSVEKFILIKKNFPHYHLYSISSLPYFLASENYEEATFTVRDRAEDHLFLTILQQISALQDLPIGIHLKTCSVLNLLARFCDFQLEKFKTLFYYLYQQTAVVTTGKLTNWDDLKNVPLLGLRALLNLAPIKTLYIENEKDQERIHHDLGSFYPIDIKRVS